MSEPSEALSEKSIADLSEIADEPRGQSRYYARAILSSQGYYYPPVITSPIDLQSFGNSNNKTEEAENQKKLVVSPNPADYQVLFDWSDYQLTDEVVIIEITDQQGNLVQILSPAIGQVTQEWTTELITGSVCSYRLLINGLEKENGQIIINK